MQKGIPQMMDITSIKSVLHDLSKEVLPSRFETAQQPDPNIIQFCLRGIKNQIWIPKGFAHGFLTMSEDAIVEYKVTNYWDKALERTLLWKDSLISIEWPRSEDELIKPNLSLKDNNGLTLDHLLKKGELF